MPPGGGGGGAPGPGGGGGTFADRPQGAGAAALSLRRGGSGGACGAPGGGGTAPAASVAAPGEAEKVWPFSRMLAASTRDCPLISNFVPVTVTCLPLRIAWPTCPARSGARSTTSPFWRYRLRTSPPGPALKARTRDVWVTMESRWADDSEAGGTRGGVGGAGTGLCANAAEHNTSPSVVIFREDGMCMGNTSACSKASRVPFRPTAKTLSNRSRSGASEKA